MTNTDTPITKLANSLVRFSATATVFGFDQMRAAMERPVAVLRAMRPIGEALDSATDTLTHAQPVNKATRAAKAATESVVNLATDVEEIVTDVAETVKEAVMGSAPETDSNDTKSRHTKHQPASARKGKKHS